MTQGIQRHWSSPDDYDQAIEAGGVTELPDSPHGTDPPPYIAGGQPEDSNPPGASR